MATLKKEVFALNHLYDLLRISGAQYSANEAKLDQYYDELLEGNLEHTHEWRDMWLEHIDNLEKVKSQCSRNFPGAVNQLKDFVKLAVQHHIFQLLPEDTSSQEKKEIVDSMRRANQLLRTETVNENRILKKHLPKGTNLLEKMIKNRSPLKRKETKEVTLLMHLNTEFADTYEKIKRSIQFIHHVKRPLYGAEKDHLAQLIHELVEIVTKEFEAISEVRLDSELDEAWIKKDLASYEKDFPPDALPYVREIDTKLTNFLKKDADFAAKLEAEEKANGKEIQQQLVEKRERSNILIGTPGFYFQEIIIVYGTHSSEKTAQEMAMIAYDFLKQKGFPVKIVGQWQDLDRKMVMAYRKRKGKKMRMEKTEGIEAENIPKWTDSHEASNKEFVLSSRNPRAVICSFHNSGVNRASIWGGCRDVITRQEREERAASWHRTKDTGNWKVKFLFDPNYPWEYTLNDRKVDKNQGHIWCGPYKDNLNLCVFEFPIYYKNQKNSPTDYWKGASAATRALFEEGDEGINQYYVIPDLKKTYNSPFSPRNLTPIFLHGFWRLMNDTYNNRNWIEKWGWKLERHTDIF